MEDKNRVSFRRKISAIGGSSSVLIPKELLEFLGAKDGLDVRLAGYTGKHGKYLALWIDGE